MLIIMIVVGLVVVIIAWFVLFGKEDSPSPSSLSSESVDGSAAAENSLHLQQQRQNTAIQQQSAQAIVVTCTCGQSYSLKTEMRGKLVQCPHCGHQMRVGEELSSSVVHSQAATATQPNSGIFGYDKYFFKQKHLSINQKYYVFDQLGNPILFIERPSYIGRSILGVMLGIFAAIIVLMVFGILGASTESQGLMLFYFAVALLGSMSTAVFIMAMFAKKRHVIFYTNDTKQQQVLEVKQDKKFYFLMAHYTVTDDHGQPLARLRKNYIYDLLRKRWDCLTPEGDLLCIAKEDSVILSLLRRVLGPLFGLLRTNFHFYSRDGQDVIGEFNRELTLVDKYVLDMSEDRTRMLDRRIAVAMGVMLDTGESR